MSDNNDGSSHAHRQTTSDITFPGQPLDWASSVTMGMPYLPGVPSEVLDAAYRALMQNIIFAHEVPVYVEALMSGNWDAFNYPTMLNMDDGQQTSHVQTTDTASGGLSAAALSNGQAFRSPNRTVVGNDQGVPEDKLQCVCGQPFTRVSNKNRHWEYNCRFNPHRKKFTCTKCGKALTRKEHSDKHAGHCASSES